VAGDDEVGEFVDDDMLDAPVGKEEEIGAVGDAAGADVAVAPAGAVGVVGDEGRADVHQLGVALDERRDDGTEAVLGFVATLAGIEGQAVEEVAAGGLGLGSPLEGFVYPLTMVGDEGLDVSLRIAVRGGDMDLAFLRDAKGEAGGATEGEEDGHGGNGELRVENGELIENGELRISLRTFGPQPRYAGLPLSGGEWGM
jgi:hypothetical protein